METPTCRKGKILRRGTGWVMRRNVPKRYADIETRTEIWKALRASSESAARKEAECLWKGLLVEWDSRLKDQPIPFEMSYPSFGIMQRRTVSLHAQQRRCAAADRRPVDAD